jgi:hypothetical protein
MIEGWKGLGAIRRFEEYRIDEKRKAKISRK